jgi:hypothetical protein
VALEKGGVGRGGLAATPGTVGSSVTSVRQCVLGVLIVRLCALVGALVSCPYFVLPLSVGVTSNLILRVCLALQGVLRFGNGVWW